MNPADANDLAGVFCIDSLLKMFPLANGIFSTNLALKVIIGLMSDDCHCLLKHAVAVPCMGKCKGIFIIHTTVLSLVSATHDHFIEVTFTDCIHAPCESPPSSHDIEVCPLHYAGILFKAAISLSDCGSKKWSFSKYCMETPMYWCNTAVPTHRMTFILPIRHLAHRVLLCVWNNVWHMI